MPDSPDFRTERRLRVRRSEAPEYLGISQRQLDYRIANKEIRTVRDGDAVFISMAELRRYASTNHPPIRNKARKEAV
jgi:hypothetical protein